MSVVLLDKAGPVATITLNRPENHNSLNLEMAGALAAAARTIAADPEIAVAIVCGAGPAFCAGGDIFAFIEHQDDLETYIRDLLNTQHRFLLQIARMPKLTIAAIHGSAAGAGLSLAAMCDMCVAEEDVRFVPAFARLGLSPDSGGTFGLARAVGTRRALRLFLAERSFSAVEAEEWGLVTRVAKPGEAARAAHKLAAQIAETGADAIANTKRLLGRLDNGILEDQLHHELESIVRGMKSERFREAVRTFTQRKAS